MPSPSGGAGHRSPHARPLKVVAAALDQDEQTTPSAGDGYTVLLKLSRVLDVDEARLIGERNPFLHATAGSRKLLAVDTTVEAIREEKDMIQMLLAEVEADALAEEARRREEEQRERDRAVCERHRRNEVLREVDW